MSTRSLSVALLPGDGIGPEVVREAVRVLEAASEAPGRPARALLVWARALHADGDDAEAARRYRQAVREDETL